VRTQAHLRSTSRTKAGCHQIDTENANCHQSDRIREQSLFDLPSRFHAVLLFAFFVSSLMERAV
jgi:hypothetical protein